jgi:hypothetical protein
MVFVFVEVPPLLPPLVVVLRLPATVVVPLLLPQWLPLLVVVVVEVLWLLPLPVWMFVFLCLPKGVSVLFWILLVVAVESLWLESW